MNTGSINGGYYAASRALASGGDPTLAIAAAKSAFKAQDAVVEQVSQALEQARKLGSGRKELRV